MSTRLNFSRVTHFSIALIFAVAFSHFCLAQTKDQDPLDLVDAVVNEVLKDIASNKDTYEKDNQKLQQMVYSRVAPHFNFTRIAQLAMGKNWSAASDQQKQQISDAFQALLVRTYANSLLDIPNNPKDRVTVKSQQQQNANRISISMAVARSHGDPVQLTLRMEKTTGNWQVIDVVIDGVSTVINYRAQFEQAIRTSGVDGLINSLKTEW